MIRLVYLLRNKIKFNFDFSFSLFSTWHCRVAVQFEYCFSIIGLYIDIYGHGMLSMGFWLLSRRNIISIVWRNWIRLKLISSSCLPIDRMYFPSVRENTIQHDRVDSIGRVFTSLVKFYLASKKTFLFYSILTVHNFFFFFFFCTTENWSAYIFLLVLYNTMLLN
jgi:hypothetical protein